MCHSQYFQSPEIWVSWTIFRDFADLDEWFFLDAVTVPAKENRYMAIGRMNDGTIAVVFAVLGTEGVSVISMRPASRKERSLL